MKNEMFLFLKELAMLHTHTQASRNVNSVVYVRIVL